MVWILSASIFMVKGQQLTRWSFFWQHLQTCLNQCGSQGIVMLYHHTHSRLKSNDLHHDLLVTSEYFSSVFPVTQEAAQCTRAVRFQVVGYIPRAGNWTARKFFMFMLYFSLILWILLIVARGSYYLWPQVTTLMHPYSFLRWIEISKPFHYFVN